MIYFFILLHESLYVNIIKQKDIHVYAQRIVYIMKSMWVSANRNVHAGAVHIENHKKGRKCWSRKKGWAGNVDFQDVWKCDLKGSLAISSFVNYFLSPPPLAEYPKKIR